MNGIMVAAHVDDGTIFLGGAWPETHRVYYASSPIRLDQTQAVEAIGEPFTAVWGPKGLIDYRQSFLDPDARRPIYTKDHIKERLGWFISDEFWMLGTREIYTHNPWGEYGHAHHRYVSDAVCELGVQYGMNVWVPDIIVRDFSQVEAADLPIYAKTLNYPEADFQRRKGEFTSREHIFPEDALWTWNDLAFTGNQRWYKIIDWGEDMRGPEVEQIKASVPVYGA